MSAKSFPTTFPIFPLPNVVLFPHTLLPLHIFEPRYRAMTRDALDGNRVIGMVLLASDAVTGEEPPTVFPVGCAGPIVQARSLPDGRFNLVLLGERRFHIRREEATDTSYRIVTAELLDDPGFENLASGSQASLDALRPELETELLVLAQAGAPERVDALRERMHALDPVTLMHMLAFGLNCSMIEKQSLLEAPDPLARASLLRRLLEFRDAERRLPDSPKNVN